MELGIHIEKSEITHVAVEKGKSVLDNVGSLCGLKLSSLTPIIRVTAGVFNCLSQTEALLVKSLIEGVQKNYILVSINREKCSSTFSVL